MAREPQPSDVGIFSDIPLRIKRRGRVAGFERMRDRLLDTYEAFAATEGRYKALKAILEVDRHALFAEVAASREQGQTDQKTYERFQAYLAGDVDTLAPAAGSPSTRTPKLPTPRGPSRAPEDEEPPDEDAP